METVLYRSLLRHKGLATDPPGEHGGLEGADLVDSVHLVDQSPVGRSPRACPASYLHALDGIRRLFAGTADAKALELAAGAFSFNTEGGRCELCKGQGSEIVEMQFLPDLTLPCPACRGRRFKQEVLSVRYRGQTIDDVLRMTLVEASAFFEGHAGVVRPLEPAIALGLGHLRMGQPINTLSGGEAQRLKLAKYLLVGESGRALFLLDEPSRGLHPPEVARLLSALASLKAAGHTLVLVEHNLDVIQAADWVVDLGPGPGPEGGRLVYQGPLAGLAGVEASRTGLAVRGLAGRTEPSVPAAAPPPETFEDIIRIQGARHHNLQDLSLDIPRGRFVVVTGVSGSGKSSLAFDILFVEGQRRYIEGLSSYMRQFIRLYERPEVDNVEGLTPTVAIEQRTSRADSRSTVATLTEVAHYLRVLFARVAIPHCPGCGRRLEAGSRREILEEIGRRWRNQDVRMLAPRVKRRKGWHQPVLEAAHRAGLGEVRIDGEFYDIPPYPGLSRYREHTIEWVFGPVRMDPASPGVADLFERAMTAGKGAITVVGEGGEEAFYSEHYICPDCGVSLADPDPLLFSFHTAAGMCPRCQGQGRLASGRTCPECHGVRLNAEARAWRIGGMGLDALLAKEVEEARSVMDAWRGGPPWADRLNRVGIPLVREVAERLAFLEEVGLGYLPLDRGGNTLSGGEAQRIRLAAQMGSGLTGLTLVLDEPTIGLHPRDNARLLRVLTALKAQGHTVVVVEHDEATLRAADWIVDLGPGGGKYGGRIVAEGTLQDIMATPESQTGAALADESRHRLVGGPGSEPEALVRLRGIRHRNLSGVDLDFPVGRFIGVCGVSGSGKSTLVSDVLSPGVEARLRDPSAPVSHCDELTGVEAFKRHVIVDHSPIGRTPRSCPATYVGLMGDLRALLAQTPAARSRGYGPERFSFNVEGGRCPACKGQGVQKVSLGFLPDSYVLCEDCQGNRFESGTLEITWKGLNIARILSLTMEEASEVFASIPVLARPLGVLCDLGLGYLTLGQASPTLSGGEAQRLKLARDLVHQNRPSTLYLLDEPTTGLHMRDVERLVAHLRKLVALGHTVMVVEHNLDVLCQTDWVIELGPGGGRHGGHILFSGPLKRFVDEAGPTPTRSALLDHLGRP